MEIKIMKIFLVFLNDNIGLITLIVGIIAIVVYFKQKKDRKREAARLILQEIRYAEQQIRIFKTSNQYQLYSRLLPTNNWNENIHLFVKDLEEHELDMISSFYAKAKYIDYLIEKRSSQIIEHANISPIPAPGVQIAFPQPNPQDLATINLLQQVSTSVEFIHNTPVVEKFRKFSLKRWYTLI